MSAASHRFRTTRVLCVVGSRPDAKKATRLPIPGLEDIWTGPPRPGQGAGMPRLGVLVLSTALLASPFLGSATYAGSTAAAGSGLHGTRGHDHGGSLSWRESVIDADQNFRGLDAVDRRTAWVTGESLTDGGPGRVFRTTDGGRTWEDVSPPGTDGLSFRDVEARSAKRAVILAIGPGRCVPDLPHDRRRRHLGHGLRQRRPRRVLRLHGVLPRRPARTGGERPGRREVPDPLHPRLRPLVDRPPERRHAGGADGVRLRRQR